MNRPGFLKGHGAKWLTRFVLATSLAVVASPSANADTILATSPFGTPYIQTAEGTLGYIFKVLDADFNVTRLGFFDNFGNGLLNGHQVGIWTANGTLLSSTTVAGGTSATLEAGFRWSSLSSPLHLSANTTYVIGATFLPNEPVDIAYSNALINPLFSVVAPSRYADGPGLIFPSIDFNTQGFFGANLAGNVPDEGQTAVLLGMGVLALVFLARLRP